MRGRSIQCNLVELTQYIAETLDKLPQTQVNVIHTDLQKTFDKVNHALLIDKIRAFGFGDSLVALCKSYMRNRKQYVVYKGFRSRIYYCPSGVIQGSNLGPFFFLVFINDVSSAFRHSSCLLYADDLKIYRVIKSDTDTAMLQSDLCVLTNWCNVNLLPLNAGKCKANDL